MTMEDRGDSTNFMYTFARPGSASGHNDEDNREHEEDDGVEACDAIGIGPERGSSDVNSIGENCIGGACIGGAGGTGDRGDGNRNDFGAKGKHSSASGSDHYNGTTTTSAGNARAKTVMKGTATEKRFRRHGLRAVDCAMGLAGRLPLHRDQRHGESRTLGSGVSDVQLVGAVDRAVQRSSDVIRSNLFDWLVQLTRSPCERSAGYFVARGKGADSWEGHLDFSLGCPSRRARFCFPRLRFLGALGLRGGLRRLLDRHRRSQSAAAPEFAPTWCGELDGCRRAFVHAARGHSGRKRRICSKHVPTYPALFRTRASVYVHTTWVAQKASCIGLPGLTIRALSEFVTGTSPSGLYRKELRWRLRCRAEALPYRRIASRQGVERAKAAIRTGRGRNPRHRRERTRGSCGGSSPRPSQRRPSARTPTPGGSRRSASRRC